MANAFSGRDATSAITFSSPGKWIVVIWPVWHVCNMNASPRSNLPAVGNIDLDAIRSIQPTVGLLSHIVPSVLCFTACASDNMIPTASTSAASSRSEFVIHPLGFLSEITLSVMSRGNCIRHSNGCMSVERENQTPPAPSAEASWYATYSGGLGSSSLTCVGRSVSLWMRLQVSRIASLQSSFRLIVFVGVFNTLFKGVKNPWVAGRMRAACRSLPITFWNVFHGIVARLNIVCASRMYLLALSGGRQTVRLIPSKLIPINVFVVSKFPSPFSSLPFDIGSFPFLWLVTAGSGKIPCIPWMDARRICARCSPSDDSVAALQKSSTYTCSSLVGLFARARGGTVGMVISSSMG